MLTPIFSRSLTLLLPLFVLACQSTNSNEETTTTFSTEGQATFVGNKQFDEYWYRGEAELNSYRLEQARYGEIHEGEAVLVFVTEPFSRTKQVKLDDPGLTPQDRVSVMKLNLTKKFYTGVYPYSIMQSTFTPIDWETFPNSLKVSTSTQEWCGHTFTQLNLNDQG
ncbi:MAG: septum formation inhibitor Maf, partial [Bacteroidota bacterium]